MLKIVRKCVTIVLEIEHLLIWMWLIQLKLSIRLFEESQGTMISQFFNWLIISKDQPKFSSWIRQNDLNFLFLIKANLFESFLKCFNDSPWLKKQSISNLKTPIKFISKQQMNLMKNHTTSPKEGLYRQKTREN